MAKLAVLSFFVLASGSALFRPGPPGARFSSAPQLRLSFSFLVWSPADPSQAALPGSPAHTPHPPGCASSLLGLEAWPISPGLQGSWVGSAEVCWAARPPPQSGVLGVLDFCCA